MLFDKTHREYFWLFVRRDLKVRYAGSSIGAFWNLIHPLVMIGVYMAIFSSIMRFKLNTEVGAGSVDYGSMGYGVHLVAGMLPWLVFSDVVMRSITVLIDNSNFLQKIYFPPVILFLAVLFNAMFVHGIGFACFYVVLLVMGMPVPWTALGGLVLMLWLGIAAMGLGLLLSGLNVFLRDTAQVMTVVMQLLFWFNPIVYIKSQIFGSDTPVVRVGRTILFFNPIERFITASQRLMGLPVAPLSTLDAVILVAFPILCLAVGLFAFRRMLGDVRDCL